MTLFLFVALIAAAGVVWYAMSQRPVDKKVAGRSTHRVFTELKYDVSRGTETNTLGQPLNFAAVDVAQSRLVTYFGNGSSFDVEPVADGGMRVRLWSVSDLEKERVRDVIEPEGELEFFRLAQPGLDDDVIEFMRDFEGSRFRQVGDDENPGWTARWARFEMETSRWLKTRGISDPELVLRTTLNGMEILLLIDDQPMGNEQMMRSIPRVNSVSDSRWTIGIELTGEGAKQIEESPQYNVRREDGLPVPWLATLDGRAVPVEPVDDDARRDRLHLLLKDRWSEDDAKMKAAILNGGPLPSLLNYLGFSQQY